MSDNRSSAGLDILFIYYTRNKEQGISKGIFSYDNNLISCYFTTKDWILVGMYNGWTIIGEAHI